LDAGGAYATGDRITGFAGCSYATDTDGNVVSRTCGTQTLILKWTADARLDTVIVGGTTIGYWYDAAGRLVRKDVNGTPQSYVLWGGDNVLAELSGSATSEVAEYSYYAVDRLHALVVGGHAYYAHTDVLGNVVALTDSTAHPQRSYKYDAWGELTGGTDNLPFGNVDRPRWKGALWLGPEVDLYYLRNRWYEPQTGRFLSEDPEGPKGGINPYLFAGDDPIDGSDPHGLAPACLDNPGIFGHCGGNSSGMDDREWDPKARDDAARDGFVSPSTPGMSVANLLSVAKGVLAAGFVGTVWSAEEGWFQGQGVAYSNPDGSVEIRIGGSRTWRDKNAGAMGYGKFAVSHGAIGKQCGGGACLAIFPDEATGWYAELALLGTYGQLSLNAAIATWCGGAGAGCNVAGYQAYVSGVTGYAGSVTLSTLDQWLVADAIRSYEKWIPGTETWRVP
jgi:RHS repeat-associated protein